MKEEEGWRVTEVGNGVIDGIITKWQHTERYPDLRVS